MPATQQKSQSTDIAELSINTIRFLAVDAVEKANSGHPGMPMGMAAAGYELWTKFLKHNPKNPKWPNRDRFVLSNGHGSMLLYSLLHLTGYDVSLDDLKNFRQWHSKTPGHPEYGDAPGIETTTGPLGQGIGTAVGMAMGRDYLNSLFTAAGEAPLFDYTIYVFAGDGCMMEGISSEACSLAGHLKLGKLIVVYDNNNITIEGKTDLAFSENVLERYKAYGWHVDEVADGNDRDAFAKAIRNAQKENRPSLISLKTHIGYGSPNKMDSEEAHGAALGVEEVKLTKQNLGWPLEPTFYIPEGVLPHMRMAVEQGAALEKEWRSKLEQWEKKNIEKAALWKRLESGRLPDGWEKAIPDFEKEEKIATRAASGKVLSALAPLLPELIGGSADLAPSNNTFVKGAPSYSAGKPARNIRFGVREHAMAAALNGLALTDMLIPYGGTFLVFSDYMKGGIRITALTKKRVVLVMTHDSIGLGEDGPTHQPIEHLAHLRATPNTIVIRPADAYETAAAWKLAIEFKTGPVVLALTRQNLPVLHKSKYPSVGAVEKGAYILSEAKGQPKLILIATGSEVSLALGAQTKLEAEGIPTRVVSMPSCELFANETDEYRESVLPKAIKARLSIEALSTFGWHKWVGSEGSALGIDHFGASAPGPIAMEKFGFTVENVYRRAKELI